ncbi:MAG TPA: diguanylate cyclase [Vicinamibacterales bacterium]|nr:diguanylate cyclase [Vicinamibacterales bacterium]
MSGFQVLIVDDSAVHRKLVEHTLSRESFTVHQARDGREAMEIFERERPSLIITDWMMPDLTGIELCRRIRAVQSSYAYIIMVTGISEKDNVVEGLAAGADDYLTKPFHAEELLARVKVGLRLIQLQRQLEDKHRHLEHAALTDDLTGLPNRRAIEAWAERQLHAAVRHAFSFWIVLLDLDHFKRVNDTHGHQAGDAVLKAVGEILKAQTRSSDICGRIGGEEFLHVLTHAEEASMPIVVERTRAKLRARTFSFGGADVTVTASFGIAGFRGETAPTFADLLSRADRALYRAKQQGRNRAEFEPLSRS